MFLSALLTGENGSELARSTALLDIERNLPFPPAKISLTMNKGVLELKTDHYARSVVLTGESMNKEDLWVFEDNFFDMMPGEIKRISVMGNNVEGVVRVKPFYSPHVTTCEG
jgi:beta-mannosidase